MLISDYPFVDPDTQRQLLGNCRAPKSPSGHDSGVFPSPAPTPSPTPFGAPQNWCQPTSRIAVQTRSVSRVVLRNSVAQQADKPRSRDVAVIMPFVKLVDNQPVLFPAAPSSFLTGYFGWYNKARFSDTNSHNPSDLQQTASLIETVCEVSYHPPLLIYTFPHVRMVCMPDWRNRKTMSERWNVDQCRI